MTLRVSNFILLFALISLSPRQSVAQRDELDEKIRDDINGLNRYERLLRSEKLLAQSGQQVSELKAELSTQAEKLKKMEDMKKQFDEVSKKLSEVGSQIEILKRDLQKNTQNLEKLTGGSSGAAGDKDQPKNFNAAVFEEINVLKDENTKTLELNRKLRQDLEAARLEIRALSKMVTDLQNARK